MDGPKSALSSKLLFPTLAFVVLATVTDAFPSLGEVYVDREMASPGAHQLASWLAAQLRRGDFVPVQEVPILPYRLPLQGKRNSEVTNAIIGSEESQKMYRDGKK